MMAPPVYDPEAEPPAVPSVKANHKRAASLSVMPDDYDARHQRCFFIHLSSPRDANRRTDRPPVSGNNRAMDQGSTGRVHARHKWNMWGSCSWLKDRCTKRPHTVLIHLRDRYGATLVYPGLPLLGVAQEKKTAAFALEQFILEFEHIREPEYNTSPETSDDQVRERAAADIEELKEIFRRSEQRRRDPP